MRKRVMTESPDFPLRRAEDLRYVASADLEALSVLRHYFLCRIGGFSSGKYESLNFGSEGNGAECVQRNRNRAKECLGLNHPVLLAKQVHGDRIAIINEANLEGMRAQPPEADAMVTKLRDVPLGILTADCMVAVIFDKATPALGIVHAGWRGIAMSIIWKTVLTMIDQFGTKSEDCYAAIGPGISAACYEVGEDVREALLQGLPFAEMILEPAGELHWRANLKEAAYRQLLDGRIPPRQVGVCPYCTHCESDLFYSARRDGGDTGRQAAIACIV